MKNKISLLMAAVVMGGASFSMAQDAVPVAITGTITNAAAALTCAVDAGEEVAFNFDGEASDWAANGDRIKFGPLATSSITIDCTNKGTATEITFATNDTSAPVGGCGEQACSSYPVVFMPNDGSPATCQDRENLSCIGDSLQEGYITVNLTGCTGGTCVNGTFGNGAKLTAAGGGMATATFSGTLQANFPDSSAGGAGVPSPVTSTAPTGDVQTSPRSPQPQLYVIYGS